MILTVTNFFGSRSMYLNFMIIISYLDNGCLFNKFKKTFICIINEDYLTKSKTF